MKRPNAAKLQKQCDEFNETYPVGSPVTLRKDTDTIQTKVRGEAFILSGHSAMAFFERVSGCYEIDRVTPARGE